MRILSITALALSSYVLLGVLSWSPTRSRLQDLCRPVPTAEAHVALWPFSVVALAGLRSRC